MKILLLGGKKQFTDVLEAQPGVELWMLHPPTPGVSEIPDNVLPYDFGPKMHLPSVGQVRDAIRRLRPDVVHAFYPRPVAHTILATTGMRNRPRIVAYRGITSKISRSSPESWITYLSPKVDAHTCESAAVKQSLVAAGAAADKCHVIYNCLTRLPSGRQGRDGLREWGIREDDFVVMMVANLRHVKGPDVLLRAALACRDLPRMKVVMVGCQYEPELLSLASDPRLEGRVVLTGPQPNAINLLSGADLFVMPSRAEALSVALLEAMSEGVCPVVSDAGGLKEAVRNERDGLVFPSDDADALAAHLRRLYADGKTRRRFAMSAQQRAEEFFSPQAMVQRLMPVYEARRAAA